MNATPQAVFAADMQNFQTDVIERSREAPVVILFWAEQMPESVEARQALEREVAARPGKLLLALADVAVDPSLAQQLRVQALPSVRVVKDGQLVDQVDGPQTAAQWSELCDRLTLSSADLLRDQLGHFIATRDFDSALAMLQQAINEEPGNQAFRVELADVFVLQGKLDDARTVLAQLGDDAPEVARPRARLLLADEAADLGSVDALLAGVAADDDDLAAKYSASVALAAADRLEEALELALDILMADRKFRDDIGRLTMLRYFDLLPKGSPLASSYRRRMFNFMH
ncbi:MAG: tetratricopeptide repeat protein [Pseudomonadota bacterium]